MKLENKERVYFKIIYSDIKNRIIAVSEKEVLVTKGKVRTRNIEETRRKILNRRPIKERPGETIGQNLVHSLNILLKSEK